MEDVDTIKAMEFLLHEFCIPASSEQFGFIEDYQLDGLQHQQQEFSESYLEGSALDSGTYSSVANNIDVDLPCNFPVDSISTPFASTSSAGMSQISSRYTDTNDAHPMGFYTEVRKEESVNFCVGKDSVVSMEKTSALDSAMRGPMDLPDTTHSSPTHGPNKKGPWDGTTNRPSPLARKRRANQISTGKKLQFSRKNTRYTFSPAHLKIFESMFSVDQYPKRVHLMEMEKQFNIPEDKLRTWFQNRRAKEKRAKLMSTNRNNCCPENTVKEDIRDKHIDGKPVQLVSPHILKTSSTSGMAPGESSSTTHKTGLVPRYPFQSGPYYNPTVLGCAAPYTSHRLADVQSVASPQLDPSPKDLEPVAQRNVRKIVPLPASPFSRVISPALSPSTGVSYASLRSVSDCTTRLPYPVSPYVQRMTMPPWAHDPQALTPPPSPSLWQGAGSGMSYPSLRPYVPAPVVNAVDSNNFGGSIYHPISKSDHIPSNPSMAHSYQPPYTSEFTSSTQKPGLPGYHGNHSMVWQPRDSLQCTQNTFPYGCNYLGTPPMKLLPCLYPWGYPGDISSSYISDSSLPAGSSPQFDQEKQSPETVFSGSPKKDDAE